MNGIDTVVARLDTLIEQVSKLREEVGELKGRYASINDLPDRVDSLESSRDRLIGIIAGAQVVGLTAAGVLMKILSVIGFL